MTDLETAVHRLTRETRTKVIQDGDSESTVAIVVHKPLLTQLNEAITSAVGNGGGGGSATGSILNDGAFDLAVFTVRAAIGSWLHIEKVKPTRNMAVDLEAWGEAFGRTEKDATFYIRQMESWAALIEGLLDPPTRQEVTDTCPICGAGEYADDEGKILGPNPVIIEFRRDRPGEIRGLCRACGELWEGVLGVRKLRWELEQKEEAG